ncbi:SdpA family antimicrobial peptide system protein [Micromonospora lupini]|nr:SdpA family antimicrobial peptide system protein [Micromonospora lupini]
MSLPPNPLSPPQQDQQKVRLFIPQGWGFFTISPRRAQLSPMRPASGGGWTDAGAGHLAVPADGFGVNRIRRAQGTEMALLLRGVRAGDWTPCSEQPGQCLAAVRPLGRVHNLAARPTLCGPVGFVRQEPLPWAWRASAGRTVMPSSVLRLEVAC